MASNNTAAMLTVVGGVFYVIGGAAVALIVGSLSSLSGGSGLGGLFNACQVLAEVGSSCGSSSTTSTSLSSLGGSGLDSLGYAVAGFGILAGVLIIVGGLLFRSEVPGRRKIAGILVIIMMLLGGLATLGGLVIGFILVAVGAYMGLTYKTSTRGMTFGLGPIGSVTLGQGAASGHQQAPVTGTGPTNYCIKCGTQLRQGAIFCQACGERV